MQEQGTQSRCAGMVLEKTLEIPLDCKEVQPVHPKGDQSWCSLEGLMLKLKLQYFGVQLFATPWTVAYQAPPSTGFSGQEYWSGVPFPSPGDLLDPGLNPHLLPALAGPPEDRS